MNKLVNFRDLGGYIGADGKKVNHKRILRSADLHGLEADDASALLEQYNLYHIVDLRSEKEKEKRPDDVLDGTVYTHLDILADIQNDKADIKERMKNMNKETARQEMTAIYTNLITDKSALAGYQRFVEVLLTTEKDATLFHCAQGKDRTGMAAAISLKLLGVSDADIMDDYMQTNVQRKQANIEIVAKAAQKGASKEMQEAIDVLMSIDASYLQAAYATMDKEYGGFDGYLRNGLGVTQGMQRDLQKLYLI